MMAIDYQDRIETWNVQITTGPPFYEIQAGAYQSRSFLTCSWKYVFGYHLAFRSDRSILEAY
jgi:hypothetical protein